VTTRLVAPGNQATFSWQDTTRSADERLDLLLDIEVLVGCSPINLPCRARVRLTGQVRVVGHDRRLVTPVSIRSVGRS